MDVSFFHINNKIGRPQTVYGVSVEFLHRNECAACPLKNQPQLKHPHMAPHGTKRPLIYAIGEAPGAEEDKRGIPFVGKSGRTLHFRLPEEWQPLIRWSNCVRTRPPNNRTPTWVEVECCRPSVVKDIELTKPKAIFGFGNVPLHWATGQNGITKWNGRRLPVKIGEHVCWFYPMLHPSYVMRTRKFEPRSPEQYGSETEFVFALDLRRALDEVEDLPDPVVHSKEDVTRDIEIITGSNGEEDLTRLVTLLAHFAEQDIVGIDYETRGVRPYNSNSAVLTVALSSKQHTCAFPLQHPGARWSPAQLGEVGAHWETFLHRARCRKVSHHLAFEQEWSAFHWGKDCLRSGRWGDTMSQAFILDERMKQGKPDALSLEFLSIQYFGINIKELSSVNQDKLDHEPLDAVLRYNAIDARYHRLLYIEQAKRLINEKLVETYARHMQRIPTMVLTQLKGVPIDQRTAQLLKRHYEEQIAKIEKQIAARPECTKFQNVAAHAFRPSATHDIFKMFRDVLHIPIDGTDENILGALDHPIARLILRWRGVSKLLSTYVLPVMEGSSLLYPDGCLHPIISTTRTRTWRTSSDGPNVQNWPKRKHKVVRKQVRASAEQRIVAFDYGQIQARNVAMESKDPALVKAFWDRYDIHADWVERIVKLYPRWVEGGAQKLRDKATFKKYRDRAKNELVFPSFFGARAPKLAQALDVPERVAEELSQEFWDMFPEIKDWHEEIVAFYQEHGYVTGLSGFRRRAPITPNELINAPIQADEALIVCDAMTRLSKIDHDTLQATLEIHDDLTFIWPKRDVEKNAEVVIQEMLNCPFDWINVPIVVEMSIGRDWANKEEVGVFASDTWKGLKNPSAAHELIGAWADGTGWAGLNK